MLGLLAKLDSLDRKLDRLLPDEPLPSSDQGGAEGGILDLFERVHPDWYRPRHFASYAIRLEQSVGGEIRIVFAAPPQHGKTELTLVALVWLFLRYPGKRFAYVTYIQGRANRMARAVRQIMAGLGHIVRGTLSQMQLPGGGQCIFTSIGGGITGDPVDGLVVVDDPFKGHKDAGSSVARENVHDAFRGAIVPRVHPGASIIVMATRWHPDDLSGVLIREGWENINLPAIAEGEHDPNGRKPGEALFPEARPAAWLERQRREVLEFSWEALYQCRPRPKGGKVFHEPTYYKKLPDAYQGAFGIDLAYTAKTSADRSVCVELWREERDSAPPLYYVVRVDSAQIEAPDFALTLRARNVNRPKFRMRFRPGGGGEKGSAQFLRRMGLPIDCTPPPGDKLVANTPTAVTWNDGRILVPDPDVFQDVATWLYPFLDVIQNFTGTGGEHDDEVDALGNAHDFLDHKPSSNKPIFSTVSSDGRFGPRPGF